ncbi:uncharacterized protein LOC105182597 [Harpegnathos saltator]|uniref:uncharacterized protein LOC105182597 n=1 Tax=Harpegnathos saltator TaxID=610380 RepID=UPI000DBEF1AF|nr:uncharacterized protein LOC105182597 [Harpegnathos saltator]
MKQRYNTLLVLQICARRRSIFSLFSIDVPPTRFYLPLHEAIVHELEENGYDESIGYLRELLELDEEARKGAGPGTLAWKKPRLKDNKSALLHLKEGFFAFEQAKNAGGDSVSMTMAFLHTATSFQTMACEWWWVAERLYRSAITNAEVIEHDGRRTITVTRYLYGRFLFEQMQNTVESLDHLKVARETSKGKSWNSSKLTGRQEQSIFRECNVLLYKTLLMHAQQADPDQPDVAVKACTEALARATDSEHREYIENALHELGQSQRRSGDVESALQSFSKLLAMAKRVPDPQGVCNAHMALALAYKELDNEMYTEKHLRLAKERAAEFGLTLQLAQAHYYTGEYFLSKRRPDVATPHLEKSFDLYNELGLYGEANKARIIAGVSRGQGSIDKYIDLVRRCGTAVGSKAISTLCQWKNRRNTFFTETKLCTEDSEDLDGEHIDETMSSAPSVTTITADVAKSNIDN